MIRLTRLNHEPFYLNPDLVQEMESTPDTVLTLSTGARIRVAEGPERVIELVVAFKRRVQDPRNWPNCLPREARTDEVLGCSGQD
jgi:flagellar protein FlbD